MPDFLYAREGGLYTPTPWAGSPWSRELQHGGPVCGLMARAAEAAARETGLRPVRLTVDLCRPVPLAPLALGWRTLRRGRRLALIEARLSHGMEEVTRASALLLAARSDVALAPTTGEPPPPGPEGLDAMQMIPRAYLEQAPPGFHRSIELRLAEDELGPAAWLTTPLGLVAGEETSPLVRAAMLSDLTFAVGGRLLLQRRVAPLARPRVALINADVTLYLERAPEGEWIAFRSAALGAKDGVGIAEVAQLDRRGRYGRSLQALVANDFSPG
jgi:hypothetical protein